MSNPWPAKIVDPLNQQNWEELARRLPWQIPSARIYNTAAQSIPANVTTKLVFNSSRWDVGDLFDAGISTTRLTIPRKGFWFLTANIMWVASTVSSWRGIHLKMNDTTHIATDRRRFTTTVSTIQHMHLQTYYKLNKGDFLEVDVAHVPDSGTVALNIDSIANYSPEFGAIWLGPAD